MLPNVSDLKRKASDQEDETVRWMRAVQKVKRSRSYLRSQRKNVREIGDTVTADEFVTMYQTVYPLESSQHQHNTTDLDEFVKWRRLKINGLHDFLTPTAYPPRHFYLWTNKAIQLMEGAPKHVKQQRHDWVDDKQRPHVIVSACAGNSLLADIAAARTLVITLREGEPFDAMYFVDHATNPALAHAIKSLVSDFTTAVAKEVFVLHNYNQLMEERRELKGSTVFLNMDAYVGFNVQYVWRTTDPINCEEIIVWKTIKRRISDTPAIFYLTAVFDTLQTNP